ncbi:alpha-(1-_3)-arabinofuranosyltransferase family protein, partial [Streptomyces sp. NPDC127119]|uniref:alpha-(1->3)-arabinofuranosyltransferase domain-containing protein n=1 Tax=Streptomyces sp. NPDC127119 TaxID=3345370 RepID=UPI00362F4CB8
VSSALAAGLGLAGLARRDIPERRWLVLTVMTAALITLAGYGGSFGAPFHGVVQDWLDGGLAPFRNIYKFQTGLALALALGLAHLVGVAARAQGARPVRGRRYAPLIAAVLVLPGLAWPYLNGSILQPGSFQELPKYWKSTASWLEKYSPDSRALVVPATAHGIFTWGATIDQPLDVLAGSRWAQRDYVPFGTAGNRRAMDAVEQSLQTGGEVPGLADYLGRAGVHYVVVRNDLDPDQLGYVPTTTVKRTLEQSGYRRLTGFGPLMTGGRIAENTPIQIEGLYPRQRAVEIYEPAADVPRPGQAGLKAVADTAVVSGGPEALLPLAADPAMRNRATVLTGDNHPGLGSPDLQVVGDGLRRADTRFGLVGANTSYTYTRTERNHSGSYQDAGEKPHQILPSDGIRHQTVAELRGARSVTASSSGNWLYYLPQYDPVNAFDGDPDTAWAEGAVGSADGQWLRIGFTEETEVPASIRVTPLPQESVRSAPTRVRVETERGSETSTLRADGSRQRIKSPEGPSRWLKVTVVESTARHSGLSGAGFSEISVPDVQVTRMLRLPRDAEDTEAAAETVSLHRASDPGSFSPTGTEVGLHRRWTSDAAGTYAVRASAIPVPGDALDALLYDVAPEQNDRITATAGSTARLGTGLSPRNLTDGDLTTAWIAGDDPTIRLSWPDKQPVGEVVLAAAGGLSTRPTEVNISSPDGAVVAGVDENGIVRFDPITTDRLDITVTETAPLTVHNPLADEDMQLPVGLTEAYIPALDDRYRTPRTLSSRPFELPCGKGPTLAVDDELYETSAKGTVGDLVARRPVELTLCQEGRTDADLSLGSGAHRVEAGDAGPLAVTDVTLTRGTVTTPTAQSRELGIRDWLGDRREVTVGSGAASYLTTYENFNDGWKATLNGRELDPVRLDGWQQGWRIPAGEGGTVKLSYEPSTVYEAGLIGGGVGVLVLAGLVLFRRRSPNPDGPSPVPPPPGPILGTVALTLVGIVIAGFLALLVPVLALLARRRHELLVPLAFLALAGAGIAAATGAGEPVAEGAGAFGRTAQLLALIGLFAGLVTVGEASYGGRGGPGGARGSGRPGTSALPPPLPGSEAPTAPLPQRTRGEHAGPGADPGPGAPAQHGVPGAPGAPRTPGTPGAPGTPGSPPPPFVPTEPPRLASGPTVSARGPGSPRTAGPAGRRSSGSRGRPGEGEGT